MDINLEGITHGFGDKKVLNGLSVKFAKGEVHCIMGPSGCGKTTLVQILMGFIIPQKGRIEGLAHQRISAVFQEDRLIEHWDALKNIQFVLPKESSKDRINSHFQEVGIEEPEGKIVGSFSGGMKRRVEIVRAMMAESDVIIMDEPLKGLDVKLRERVIQYIHNHRGNRTLIVITHDKEEVNLLRGKEIILESQL